MADDPNTTPSIQVLFDGMTIHCVGSDNYREEGGKLIVRRGDEVRGWFYVSKVFGILLSDHSRVICHYHSSVDDDEEDEEDDDDWKK